MTKRQKAKGATTLDSWAAADDALKKVGELTREIAKKDASATEKIEAAKARLKMDTAEQLARKKALLHDLEAFAINNKSDLIEEAGKKTIQLNHGKLGFRKSTKIAVAKTVAAALELLNKSKKGKAYIRIKEELDKEAMRKLDDKQLEGFGMIRKESDEFWCEPSDTTAKAAPAA